jgi:hypothetical protein
LQAPPAKRPMIKVEHLIYGTFSTSGMAQHVPSQSPGIDSHTKNQIISFCNSWGECRNLKFFSSLNQFYLETPESREAQVAVIKITHHGQDFAGRKGALLRHALVFKTSDYSLLQFDPFKVEKLGKFKTSWAEQEKCDSFYVDPANLQSNELQKIPSSLFASLREHLAFLLKGFCLLSYRNVNTPTSDLYLKYLYSLIPHTQRDNLAFTTFAFRNNKSYRLGCIYSPDRIPEDSLSVEFEKIGPSVSLSSSEEKIIRNYIDQVFLFLEQKEFPKVSELIKGFALKSVELEKN